MIPRVINVALPKNATNKNSFFINRSYEITPLKVLIIRNIDVTHNGICFKNSKIIKESVQAYPDKVKIFELEGQLQFRTKLTKIFNDQTQYLIIHHPWLNYYHWLTEAIPRIWMVKDLLVDLILLLPYYYKNISFVQDSLKPFNFKGVEYIPDGYNVKISNAVLPQIKPFCSFYDPDVLNELRNYYVEYAKRSKLSAPELGERIYIMRGTSLRRKIVNEESLVDILEKFNFKSINTQFYSFFEQVLFSENAKYLISNGSGLTNMQFMKSSSSVLEMQKRITNMNDFHDLVLWYMASGLNLYYYYFLCNPVNRYQDLYFADLTVNLKKFEEMLIRMLDNHY
jgi:capsular polysaccharide biosynthesis protein